MNWKHDDLARDLAAHLRCAQDRMVWTDMQLGPAGSMRPDVFTMAKSYSRPAPHAYECKISVGDFRGDITSGKYLKYYENASLVTFAVPQGLVTKADIPKGCGLIVRGENGWHTVKGATAHKCEMTKGALLKLLIDGLDRWRIVERKQRTKIENEHQLAERIRHKVGDDVANYIRDRARAEESVKKIYEEYQAVRAQVQEIAAREKEIIARFRDEAIAELDKKMSVCAHPYRQLCDALGVDGTNEYVTNRAIKAMIDTISEDGRIRLATRTLLSAKREIDSALKEMGVKDES